MEIIREIRRWRGIEGGGRSGEGKKGQGEAREIKKVRWEGEGGGREGARGRGKGRRKKGGR